MEGNYAQHSGHRELVLPDNKVYANIDLIIYQMIEYILTKLDPVSLEDLGPDDRDCPICQAKFCVSDDPKLSHPPVRTVCGHVFGKYCIIKWLDPLSYWGKAEDEDRLIPAFNPVSDHTNTDCPTCRKTFFPEPAERSLSLHELNMSLRLWDLAYQFVGINLSEKEERSRKYLWEFTCYCLSVNEFNGTQFARQEVVEWVQVDFWEYLEWLKSQALNPVQKKLQKDLTELAVSRWFVLIELGYDINLVPREVRRAYLSAGNNDEDDQDEDEDEEVEDEENQNEQDEDEDGMDDDGENEEDQNEQDEDEDGMDEDSENEDDQDEDYMDVDQSSNSS